LAKPFGSVLGHTDGGGKEGLREKGLDQREPVGVGARLTTKYY